MKPFHILFENQFPLSKVDSNIPTVPNISRNMTRFNYITIINERMTQEKHYKNFQKEKKKTHSVLERNPFISRCIKDVSFIPADPTLSIVSVAV